MSPLSDLTRLNSNGARQREAPRSDGGVRGRRREARLGAGVEQTGKAASGKDAEKRGGEWGRRRRARQGAGEAPKSKAGSGGDSEEEGRVLGTRRKERPGPARGCCWTATNGWTITRTVDKYESSSQRQACRVTSMHLFSAACKPRWRQVKNSI